MRAAIILAAGKGVRMKSDLPKVFHSLDGKPMLSYVIDAVKGALIDRIYLVVGYRSEMIRDHYKDAAVVFVEQGERLGTGHAVAQVEPALSDHHGTVIVLAGDMPLISPRTISGLITSHEASGAKATVLTAKVNDPAGYGRIIRRESGEILRIVEQRDASEEEKKVNEINTGIYCFDSQALFGALKEVKADNDQKEYYLTDTISILRERGDLILSYMAEDPLEARGINTVDELLATEKIVKSRRAGNA